MEPQKSSQEEEAIGKSRGGLSTKIHAAVDAALGNPVRLILTTGQASEYSQAERLIQGFLITTNPKPSFRSFSGIGGVLKAT